MEASSEIGFLDETHYPHLSPSSNDPLSWVITYRFPSFLSIPFPFLPLPNHSLPTFTGRINENTIESETRTKYKERPETFPSVINQSINLLIIILLTIIIIIDLELKPDFLQKDTMMIRLEE